MKPKYTATDLFKIRKTLKLLAQIDKMNEDYIDVIFERMTANNDSSRDLIGLRYTYKDFLDEKLPGLTINRLKTIAHDYKMKKNARTLLKIELLNLSLNNRLLPLDSSVYQEFSKRSNKHFYVTSDVRQKHYFGKREGDKYEYTLRRTE